MNIFNNTEEKKYLLKFMNINFDLSKINDDEIQNTQANYKLCNFYIYSNKFIYKKNDIMIHYYIGLVEDFQLLHFITKDLNIKVVRSNRINSSSFDFNNYKIYKSYYNGNKNVAYSNIKIHKQYKNNKLIYISYYDLFSYKKIKYFDSRIIKYESDDNLYFIKYKNNNNKIYYKKILKDIINPIYIFFINNMKIYL